MRVCVYARVSGASISVDLLVAFFYFMTDFKLVSSNIATRQKYYQHETDNRCLIEILTEYWSRGGEVG